MFLKLVSKNKSTFLLCFILLFLFQLETAMDAKINAQKEESPYAQKVKE